MKVRITICVVLFTHANPDFLKDVQQMLDLGFRELSMEPVVAKSDDPAKTNKGRSRNCYETI